VYHANAVVRVGLFGTDNQLKDIATLQGHILNRKAHHAFELYTCPGRVIVLDREVSQAAAKGPCRPERGPIHVE
jgi:hypothetical protein